MSIEIIILITTIILITMSILGNLTNTILAPFKVFRDKIYDKLTREENYDTEIHRMHPSDKITEYRVFFGNPTEVYPKLFLGSAFNAATYQTLKDNNIKYIINATKELSNYYEDEFTYYQIPMRDNNVDSMFEHFEDSFNKIEEFMNNNDGNILIHCYMGASRSATIAANYISKKQNMNVLETIEKIRELRPHVNLTQQFYNDLIASSIL